MATIETISEALKLVDEKKDNLRKAFDELQSHSSFLSSFTLSWSDIDAHFSALHSTVLHKFDLLKSQPSVPNPQIEPSPSIKSESDGKERESVAAWPELKSFCESMNGLGLRSFIIKKKPKERLVIGAELVGAFKCAPDAAAMVLDTLEGFFEPNTKGAKDEQLLMVRKACVVMLESLMESKVEVSAEVRERAKNLALDWKNKVSVDGTSSSSFEPYGFLYLVAIYGLVDAFTADDILDMAVVATKFAHSFRLLHVLCTGEMMSELIQRSISKGLHFQAVKCVLEFKLADKFPPVPLLEAYVNEAKMNSLKIREDGKQSMQALNEATTKEVNALTSVVKIIKDRELDAESLKQTLVKRIEVLEKEKANRKKQPQPPHGPKSKPQNLSGTKRPRLTTQAHLPNSAVFASSANKPAFHQAAAPRVAAKGPAVAPFQQPYSAAPHVAAKGPAVAPFQQPYSAAPTFASTNLYQQSYPQFVPGGEVRVPIAATTTTSSTGQPYKLSYVQHTPGGQVNGSASTYQQSYLQPSGLLPDHHTGYSSSSTGGFYGSAEASLGMVGSSTHAQPHAYATEPNTSSGYHDGSANYGGYAMPPPQYLPPYHQPQQ